MTKMHDIFNANSESNHEIDLEGCQFERCFIKDNGDGYYSFNVIFRKENYGIRLTAFIKPEETLMKIKMDEKAHKIIMSSYDLKEIYKLEDEKDELQETME
jgi:hypothetical protein